MKSKPKLPKFVVINNKDQFFTGLLQGFPVWSDDPNGAKEFNDDRKMNYFEQNEFLWGKITKMYI